MYSLLFVPTSFSRTVGRCLSKLHWPQKLPQDLRCEPQIEKFGLSRLRSRYPCIRPGHLIAAVPELEMMRNAGFSKSKADRWLSLLVENRQWEDTSDDDEKIRQQVQYKSALRQKETKTFSKLMENFQKSDGLPKQDFPQTALFIRSFPDIYRTGDSKGRSSPFSTILFPRFGGSPRSHRMHHSQKLVDYWQ